MNIVEPSIQYIRTADETNLAYWTLGHGEPPLVLMPGFPMSHLEREWAIPKLRAFYQFMAARRMLIRFDWRGTGLSQRDVADVSLRAQCADLHSLLQKIESGPVALFAAFTAGPVALTYALEYPGEVSHLVLWHAFARGNDYLRTPRMQSILSLASTDWEFFTEAATLDRLGWSDTETAMKTAELVRAASSYDMALRISQEVANTDLTDRLGEIRVPTLVIHRRDYKGLDIGISTNLAARLPNSKLILSEGSSGYFFGDNVPGVSRLIHEFLNQDSGTGNRELARLGRISNDLTPRELEILALLAAGFRDKEIALKLDLTSHTVHRHVANIYKKIDAHGRADATAFAMREGLVM